MSMLSSMCNQLRELAVRFDGIFPENAAIMRQAADTIWELRNDYVKLRDENERLRMNANQTARETRRVREAWEKDREKLLAECQHSHRLAENLEAGERENAKLREMLAEDNEELAKMRRVIDYLYSFAKACGVDAEDVRELGIEV